MPRASRERNRGGQPPYIPSSASTTYSYNSPAASAFSTAPAAGTDPLTPSEPPAFVYSRFRVALGGGVGLGFVPDGTGYPFGFVAGLAFPLGTRVYARGELFYSYFTTSEDDTYYVGGSGNQYENTYIDSEHSLIAVRALAGLQFSQLVSARLGLLVGARNLYVEHGLCGSSYAEDEFGSTAIGGSGALAFHTRHAEFAITFDAYTAKTQGYCSATTFGGETTGTLLGTDKLGMQLFALGSYLL